MLTALSASLWALMVMKAKPFDTPLLRSLMTLTDVTSPAWVNRVFKLSSVVDLERFPTNNVTSTITTFSACADKENRRPITGSAADTPHKSSYTCSTVALSVPQFKPTDSLSVALDSAVSEWLKGWAKSISSHTSSRRESSLSPLTQHLHSGQVKKLRALCRLAPSCSRHERCGRVHEISHSLPFRIKRDSY